MKVLASWAATSSNVGLASEVKRWLVVSLERIPRQLQAQLPGDIIRRGLQKSGPGAELLKPGEEVLTACPRKRFDFIEALVGDEAAGVAAGGR
jgi:hypothetical protein